MKVQVVNWKEYNPRKDVKSSSWFRMEHAIMLSTKYLDLNQHDILALIYVLSLCSETGSAAASIDPRHAGLFSRVTIDQLGESLNKLEQHGIVKILTGKLNTSTSRENHAPVIPRTNERDERTTTEQHPLFDPPPLQKKPTVKEELPAIARLWNDIAVPELPRVVRCSAKRRKRLEKIFKTEDEAFWRDLFGKINESKFLTGKTKPLPGRDPFFARLDWILDEENFDQVVEGKYFKRGSVEEAPHPMAAEINGMSNGS